MAFKLSIANKVTVPVKFSMDDDGKVKNYAFSLICERVDTEQFQADIKNDDGIVTDAKLKSAVMAATTGWKNQTFVCNEDDTPADFCPEALEVMLGAQGVLLVVFQAYMKASTAKAKN